MAMMLATSPIASIFVIIHLEDTQLLYERKCLNHYFGRVGLSGFELFAWSPYPALQELTARWSERQDW